MGSQLATSVRQSVTTPLVFLLKPNSSPSPPPPPPQLPLSGFTTHNLTFPLGPQAEELDTQLKVSSTIPANTLTRESKHVQTLLDSI